MKPRILQLIDSFNEGGSERQALQLTRLLVDTGRYEVFLASLGRDGVLRAQAETLVAQIESYPLTTFYDRNAAIQLSSFVRYLRDHKIDLIHTHDFYTNIFGMCAGMVAGVPVRIASQRETDGMRSTSQRLAQRIAYCLATHIVANSEAVRRRLIQQKIAESRITLIHNGIDMRRLKPVLASRDEILDLLGADPKAKACGRFVTIVANMRHDVKDYPMFLRAAQQVAGVFPDTGFLLAGDGQLQNALKEMAVELGINESTFFLGRCENLAALLEVSDVCVLSSKAEGFSNSILEYMAAGRPVVATDVGGAREAIVEGQNGFLVPSGNEQLMAEQIVKLLSDPERARSLGEFGKHLVERKFSSSAQLRNTEELYHELLAGRGKTNLSVLPEPALAIRGSHETAEIQGR